MVTKGTLQRPNPLFVVRIIFLYERPGPSFTVIRLCVEKPTIGSRIFGVSDEKILKLAHKTQRAFSTSPLLHSVLIDW